MATKIAFINNKGGSTKTTTLVNLAGAISKRFPKKRILVIDGDAQGNASSSFGIDASNFNNTIYDVFMGNIEAERVVIQAYDNIDIIPANTTMNYLEFDVMERYGRDQNRNIFNLVKTLYKNDVALDEITYEQFNAHIPQNLSPTHNYFNMLDGDLDKLDRKYDVILFDTPPELKAVTSSILAVADKAIIPFEPDTYAIDGIINILNRIKSIQGEYNPNLEITGLLAAKVKKTTRLHSEIRANVMKFCMREGLHYFQTEIPNSIRYASAIATNGLPATIVKPDNEFSKSYYDVLDELIALKIIKKG